MKNEASDSWRLVLGEGAKARPRVLRGEVVVLGRGRDADLRLTDRSLSAQHCRFVRLEDGWKVVDLDSRNGTFVNDVLVKQRRLEDGDHLRLGRVRLVVHGPEAEAGERREIGKLVARWRERHGPGGLKRLARLVARAAGLGEVLAAEEGWGTVERLHAVIRAVVEERRPKAVLERIVDALIEFTGAERGFFILTGPSEEERQVVSARNFDREGVRDALAKVSRSVERQALESGEPVLVSDAEADDRFSGTESVVDLRLRSILAVPVCGPKGAVGLIYLDNRFERGVFEEGHLPLIRMFADQAALALENARLHEESAHRLGELSRAKDEVEELNRILAERMAHTRAALEEVKERVLREGADAPLKYSYANIVGKSPRMQELFHLLDKVTDSDVPVLIQGESGTGKELVARALHFNGPRKNRPFISENCAAIPETLLESELFGYVKGSFTGALADKKGLFEAANGGTLLLDEIGDMSMSMQKKLLRVLQEREVRPVGGQRLIPVDVRILAASNQDLRAMCSEGRFREDLFYRLNVITVDVPPLRDRRDDIPLLVERFLEEFAQAQGGPPRAVAPEAMEELCRYDWPGNVRELKNEVKRAAALSDTVIGTEVLSSALRGHRREPAEVAELGTKSLKDMVRAVTDDLERRVIEAALRRTGGKKAGAARLLGISRPTLDSKIEAYGIEVKRE